MQIEKVPDLIHPSNGPPLRYKYIPLRTNRPISSTKPHHFLYGTAPFIYKTAPVLSCFCHIPIKRTHRHYATSPQLKCNFAPNPRIHCPKCTHFRPQQRTFAPPSSLSEFIGTYRSQSELIRENPIPSD